MAIAYLENAAEHWIKYGDAVDTYNNAFPFYQTKPFSVSGQMPQVLDDIEKVKKGEK